jgi:hypothetical protein
MAKNKTTETEINVTDFVGTVKDETCRTDCFNLIDLIKENTKLEPKM